MTGRPLTKADIMRAADVAELLGMPSSTVYQYARECRIPHRRRGRHLIFLRWEIADWLIAADPQEAE